MPVLITVLILVLLIIFASCIKIVPQEIGRAHV